MLLRDLALARSRPLPRGVREVPHLQLGVRGPEAVPEDGADRPGLERVLRVRRERDDLAALRVGQPAPLEQVEDELLDLKRAERLRRGVSHLHVPDDEPFLEGREQGAARGMRRRLVGARDRAEQRRLGDEALNFLQ